MVYLIHFNKAYKHSQHYIGYTENLERRMHSHELGNDGSRLLQVVRAAGIDFKVVRTWDGDRKLERKLKNRHNAGQLCPVCIAIKKEKAAKKAAKQKPS